jgi:hypothetical protein
MITAHESGLIAIWSFYTRRVKKQWQAHSKEILGLACATKKDHSVLLFRYFFFFTLCNEAMMGKLSF